MELSASYLKTLNPDIADYYYRMLAPDGSLRDLPIWQVETSTDLYCFKIVAKTTADFHLKVYEAEYEEQEWTSQQRNLHIATTEDRLWLRDCGIAWAGDQREVLDAIKGIEDDDGSIPDAPRNSEGRVLDIGERMLRAAEARTDYRRLRRP